MNLRTICLLTILISSFSALPAAADNPFYLAGKIGRSDVDADLGDSVPRLFDDDDNSKAFALGFRFGRFLAFQAEWHDFGEVSGVGAPCEDPAVCNGIPTALAADGEGISVSVLPHLTLGSAVSVYAKVGIISWDSDITAAIGDLEERIESRDDETILYGAGVRAELLGPVGLFAEYESVGNEIDTFSIGATLGF